MTSLLMMHEKITDELGNAVEIKIWKVPISGDIPHGYKYSLVYIVGGKRVVGYDNAEGKGDHKHIGARESEYAFISIRRLVRDFQADVRLYKEKHDES
ncbi:MAG: DUF6516 family protein [Bacteroidota bacterium]